MIPDWVVWVLISPLVAGVGLLTAVIMVMVVLIVWGSVLAMTDKRND